MGIGVGSHVTCQIKIKAISHVFVIKRSFFPLFSPDRSSSALYCWSSTQILLDYWGHLLCRGPSQYPFFINAGTGTRTGSGLLLTSGTDALMTSATVPPISRVTLKK